MHESFSSTLKESTLDIHRIVETKPIMKQLIKGTLQLEKYCHLLAGLERIYSTLESCLDANSNHPVLSQFIFKELYRSQSLKNDLRFFNYSKSCNCKSVDEIVIRIQLISKTQPEKLIAYSYVRYLGDLSGGVFLQKRIVKNYNLAQDSLGSEFYQFPGIENGDHFKNVYRCLLNQIPVEFQDGILQETRNAFEFHGPLFDEMLDDCKKSCVVVNGNIVDSLRSFGVKHSHLNLVMGIVVLAVGMGVRSY